MVREYTATRGELTSVILLNGHSIKLPSKSVSPYPHISQLSDLIREVSLCSERCLNRDSQLPRTTVSQVLSTNGTSVPQPCLKAPGLWHKRQEGYKETGKWNGIWKKLGGGGWMKMLKILYKKFSADKILKKLDCIRSNMWQCLGF